MRRERRLRSEPASPGFAPTRVDEVELGAPLPALPSGETETGVVFAASLCLARLHGRPLGLVQVDLPRGGLPAEELAARIEADLSAPIASHLRGDGAAPVTLTAAGIAGLERPACNSAREELLSRAPAVSIVICTRDRPESVRGTLRSILASRYPTDRYEVIVVDNASSTDSPVRLEAAELDGGASIRVVREPEPGLSHARNKGLREARGEIVVFADDDVEVDRDWLATLIAPFGRGPEVGATSGMTLPGALETPTQRWVEGFGGRRRSFDVRVFDTSKPPPDRPLFPFTVGDLGAGRNMAFRRDVLSELGGFDPALGPGTLAHDGDDIEALLRVLLSGRQIVHDPAAIVWHAHPRDYGELEQRVWGYGIGLTACLTRAVLDHPGLLVDLVSKLPRGLAFALSPASEKNVGRQADFPRALARRERGGMAYGPIAYLRSRRHQRRRRRAAVAEQSGSQNGPASLRVLIVSDEYRPYIGGAGRCIELFAQELSRLGHTVAIATAWHPDAPAFEDDGRVAVHRVRDLPSRMRWISEDPKRHTPPPFPDPEAVWRLRRLIRDFRPDLVPAYGWLAHSAATALLGTKIPFVLWGHEYGNTCAVRSLVRKGEICSGPGPAKCLACATSTRGVAKGVVATASVFAARPLLRRKTTALHGVSRYVAEVMGRDLRMAGTPSVVIPNFHEEEADGQPDERLVEALPSDPFILFVGAFRRVKGIHELFAAYERLEDPPPLVLVGIRTPDTPQSFPAGVTVLTAVPHATVMAMWERALFGVFPSTWPEPLATVVHEAMSKGRPVIATRAGGHVDMVDDGETGLLVEPGDAAGLAEAMARLIDDERLRERLGRQARERARRFSRDAVVPELDRFYRETVSGWREGQS
jgi:glycosyltransferase involved in cell wall biosynthesis/GT2 family glycosyltransferase